MTTGFISHPACYAHLSRRDHPDLPDRLSAIEDRLISEGLYDFLQILSAPRASREELERIHTAEHVRRIFSLSPTAGSVELDADTVMEPATLEAALRAAGAAVMAVDFVLAESGRNAFCNVRPPGHHATRDAAMGFCFFNNIAAGAAHALDFHGLRRIAVIDFDAHHGNGTEDIFGGDERVLFCSSFQRDLFPEPSGEGRAPNVLNLELGAGAGGPEYREAVDRSWRPALERFQPEMVFVSAGFDAHAADPISDLRLGDEDYVWISEIVVDLAGRHAGGRLVSVLEGGYELASLGRCGALHVRALLGI